MIPEAALIAVPVSIVLGVVSRLAWHGVKDHNRRVDAYEKKRDEFARFRQEVLDKAFIVQANAESRRIREKKDRLEKNRRLNDPSYLERRVREARNKPPTD